MTSEYSKPATQSPNGDICEILSETFFFKTKVFGNDFQVLLTQAQWIWLGDKCLIPSGVFEDSGFEYTDSDWVTTMFHKLSTAQETRWKI